MRALPRLPHQHADQAGRTRGGSSARQRLFAALTLLSFWPTTGLAQPLILPDAAGDAVIRRTDDDGDGVIDPNTQRLPDILSMRIGAFSPYDPADDRFAGVWSVIGGYARFDLVFDGLINPPGPLGWDDVFPVYDPFLYGANPVFGYIEFDMDADEGTGGELSTPQYRYLGNVARFGGLPADARFAGRVAEDAYAFDGDVVTPPWVDRSGEEFHLTFLGEEVDSINVKQEKPGGIPGIFEQGEIWRVEGKLLHRAHGFEGFAFMCFNSDPLGNYEAHVFLRFEHDPATDTTTVSLVYPLQNAGSAAFSGPTEPVEPNDGCSDGQNSVEEALEDLQFSAEFADPADRSRPEFQLIAGWEFKTVSDHLDPAAWRITALLGTAYGTSQPDGARFAWTDVHPDPRVGDFDGNGLLDAADLSCLNSFIASKDGNPQYDDDGNAGNGSLDWHDFADNFSLYDSNYDGFVDANDGVVLGDMDLDQLLTAGDVDDFVQALVDPAAYAAAHNGVNPVIRGDTNGDADLDGDDINGFVILLIGP